MTDPRPVMLRRYRNGNYTVAFYDDGTKIKYTADDCFSASFPDSIDLKITDYCDLNCRFCHESASERGEHGRLASPFLATLNAGTELAIGGGNALSHPELDAFLCRMSARGVICNITVNEKHFLRERARIESLLERKLIYGLGISVSECDGQTIEFARAHSCVILHLICGIADEAVFSSLSGHGLKILLLGYKKFGRGEAYFSPAVAQKLTWLERNIMDVSKSFHTVCFDNAAINQLGIKDKLPEAEFDARYMGDDGDASMYIDLVRGQYSVSSASTARYPLERDITTMFDKIKNRGGGGI